VVKRSVLVFFFQTPFKHVISVRCQIRQNSFTIKQNLKTDFAVTKRLNYVVLYVYDWILTVATSETIQQLLYKTCHKCQKWDHDSISLQLYEYVNDAFRASRARF